MATSAVDDNFDWVVLHSDYEPCVSLAFVVRVKILIANHGSLVCC